jgi:diketogulonate reductase-like aldo/keto reductase
MAQWPSDHSFDFAGCLRVYAVGEDGVTAFTDHGNDMPLMAYSPLGGPDAGLLRDLALARFGAARGCSAAAVALAWTIRNGKVIAIPESGSAAHVKDNAAVALALTLTPEELEALDAAHPPLGR